MIQPNQPTPKPAPVRERHRQLFADYAAAVALKRKRDDWEYRECLSTSIWRCSGHGPNAKARKTRGKASA